MADAGFPKQSRLLSSRDFSPVFDKPDQRLSSRYLLVLARTSDNEQARIGLVVGKRHIRRAVSRNRIKRVLRESFRVMKNDFATIDIVFLVRGPLDKLSSGEIRAESERLLIQLAKRLATASKLKSE